MWEKVYYSTANLPMNNRLEVTDICRMLWKFVGASTIGSRTFKVAAAQTWNGPPEDVSSSLYFAKDSKLVC